jgi:hypothetical protein
MWGCSGRLHLRTQGENQGPSFAGDKVESTMTRGLGTKSIVDPEICCEGSHVSRRIVWMP